MSQCERVIAEIPVSGGTVKITVHGDTVALTSRGPDGDETTLTLSASEASSVGLELRNGSLRAHESRTDEGER